MLFHQLRKDKAVASLASGRNGQENSTVAFAAAAVSAGCSKIKKRVCQSKMEDLLSQSRVRPPPTIRAVATAMEMTSVVSEVAVVGVEAAAVDNDLIIFLSSA